MQTSFSNKVSQTLWACVVLSAAVITIYTVGFVEIVSFSLTLQLLNYCSSSSIVDS